MWIFFVKAEMELIYEAGTERISCGLRIFLWSFYILNVTAKLRLVLIVDGKHVNREFHFPYVSKVLCYIYEKAGMRLISLNMNGRQFTL